MGIGILLHAKTLQQTRGNGEKKDEAATGNPSLASKKQLLAGMSSIASYLTKMWYINKDLNGNAAMDEGTLMEVTTLSHPPGRVLEEDCNSEINTRFHPRVQDLYVSLKRQLLQWCHCYPLIKAP